MGHSYGAAVALKAALDAPGRVRSLTLFEPVLFSVLLRDDPDQAAAREIASVRDDTIAAVNRGDVAEAGRRFVDYWMGAEFLGIHAGEATRQYRHGHAQGEGGVARSHHGPHPAR